MFDDLSFEGKIFMLFLIILFIGMSFFIIVDEEYKKPTASDKANQHCKNLGYDQYKEFSRIGILSETPVAIKCEFAERYTDLGIRTNIQ